MRRVIYFCVGVLVLSGWGIGCRGVAHAKAPPKPTLPLEARPAPSPSLPAQDIDRAAKLSLNKCVRCHALYDPAQYSGAAWTTWMGKMSRKAHLKSDQSELLSRYFEGFRQTNSATTSFQP